MPTGYTASIEKGISFKQFVLQCARAFGALIDMRDDPMDAEIPDEFKPSDHYLNALAKAKNELKRVKTLTVSEAEHSAELEYKEKLQQHEEYIAKKRELKAKYEKMLDKVKLWTPPTPDHAELKKFMIDQINGSIKFDCDTSYSTGNPPKLMIGHEWLQAKINQCLKDVEYYSDELEKENKRYEGRTSWVRELKQSLINEDE